MRTSGLVVDKTWSFGDEQDTCLLCWCRPPTPVPPFVLRVGILISIGLVYIVVDSPQGESSPCVICAGGVETCLHSSSPPIPEREGGGVTPPKHIRHLHGVSEAHPWL